MDNIATNATQPTPAEAAQPAQPAEAKPAEAAQPAEAKPGVGKTVRGRLFTRFRLEYVSGTSEDGPYEFVAAQVAVGDQIHDVRFDTPEAWNELAQSAAPSAEIWLSGVLSHDKKPYWVNQGSPKAYERMTLRSPMLDDIVESRGAALAFKRGARLPSWNDLKRRAMGTASESEEALV